MKKVMEGKKRGPPLVALGDLPKAILAIVVKQMPVGITALMKKRKERRKGTHTGLMVCRIQGNCFQRMHGHCWFCLAATRPGWPLN